MSDTPYFTPTVQPGGAPDDLAAQVAAGQAASPGGITSVDADKLLAAMAQMQARLDALEAERAAGTAPPVLATAEALRDLIKTHASQAPGADHSDVLRLADDAVDAASLAADSGDGAALHAIAGKVARALARVHPGPGDFHWHRQAVAFAEVHLPDAADQLVPKSRAAVAPAPGSAPVPVIQGSVTG